MRERKIKPSDKPRVLEMLQQGRKKQDIAKVFGCKTYRTVTRFIEEFIPEWKAPKAAQEVREAIKRHQTGHKQSWGRRPLGVALRAESCTSSVVVLVSGDHMRSLAQ